MSAFLFILIFLGTTTITGVSMFKASDQRKKDRERVTYELTFPNDLNPDRIIAFLRSISAVTAPRFPLGGVMTTAYELHADGSRIHAYMRIPEVLSGGIIRQLHGAIPGMAAAKVERPFDYDLDYAVEVGMSSPSKPLDIKNIADVSTSILKSIDALSPGEYIVIQFIVSPAPRQKLPSQGSTSDEFKWVNLLVDRSSASKDEVMARRSKLQEPNFRGVLRVGAHAKTENAAKMRVKDVRDRFQSTSSADNKWIINRRSMSSVISDIKAARGASLGAQLQLSAPELAALIGWRIDGAQVAGLPSGRAKFLAASPSVARTGRKLGVSNYPGDERPIAISYADSCRHLHWVGKTGSGKTVAFGNLAAQDIKDGRGMVVIDPKGDLFNTVSNYIPRNRIRDVVVLDVNDTTRPVGFNMLGQGSPQTTAFEIQSIFDHIYKTSGQVTMPQALHHLLMALMTTSAGNGKLTFLEIMCLIAPKNREETLLAKAIVDGIPDPYIKDWFLELKKNKSAREQAKQYESLSNRIWQFTSRPEVRNIVGQSESSIDMLDIVKNKKILLVNFKGLPDDVAALIGSLIVNNLWHVAKSGYTSESDPFMLYLDEFQHFVHSPIAFDVMLAEARSFGLAMHMAHQGLDQLAGRREVKTGLMNNANTRVVMQRGHEDAAEFANDFGSPVVADEFKKLGRFEFLARVAANGEISPPLTGITNAPLEPYGYGKEVREWSRERYGRSLEEVTASIHRRRQVAGGDPDQRPTVGDEDWQG